MNIKQNMSLPLIGYQKPNTTESIFVLYPYNRISKLIDFDKVNESFQIPVFKMARYIAPRDLRQIM